MMFPIRSASVKVPGVFPRWAVFLACAVCGDSVGEAICVVCDMGCEPQPIANRAIRAREINFIDVCLGLFKDRKSIPMGCFLLCMFPSDLCQHGHGVLQIGLKGL